MKRIRDLLRKNRDKLFKVSRNDYMVRESLLLERVDMLKVIEIIDDLQEIIDLKGRNKEQKDIWDEWRKSKEPFFYTAHEYDCKGLGCIDCPQQPECNKR